MTIKDHESSQYTGLGAPTVRINTSGPSESVRCGTAECNVAPRPEIGTAKLPEPDVGLTEIGDETVVNKQRHTVKVGPTKMTSWLRQVEDFLETVDRTAANVAVIRERAHADRADSQIDEQLAALEPSGLRKPGKEKAAGGRNLRSQSSSPVEPSAGRVLSPGGKPQSADKAQSDRATDSLQEDGKGAGSRAVEGSSPSLSVASEPSLGRRASVDSVLADRDTGEAAAPNPAEEETPPLDGNGRGNGAAMAPDQIGSWEGQDDGLGNGVSPLGSSQQEIEEEDGGPANGARPHGNGAGPLETATTSNGVHGRGEGHAPEDQADADAPKVPKTVAVQRELDEARGLLKGSASVGQSKEARLARICASLSQRLQEYKAENAQLEELLSAERNGRGNMDSTVRALQHQLAQAQAEIVAAEASTAGALAAKNQELETLGQALAESKRQAAVLEGQLASLQANTEVITKNRDATEARMIQGPARDKRGKKGDEEE